MTKLTPVYKNILSHNLIIQPARKTVSQYFPR